MCQPEPNVQNLGNETSIEQVQQLKYPGSAHALKNGWLLWTLHVQYWEDTVNILFRLSSHKHPQEG